jgi:NifU-like protein involved in Fe-S cluster formation
MKLTNKAVAEALDGLPDYKMHCSVLAEEAIKSALEDYEKRKGSGNISSDSLSPVEREVCYRK